jgi:type I restriction enzyme S subunit
VKLVNHPFAVGADGIKIFSPAADVLPKYLYYWMKSAPIENRGYGRHYQYLRKLNVPVPSVSKQQVIVDEIETQFSRLDEAVANLQRVKANLKRYKASVLKAAVEGRLVETEASIAQREGRSYETGEQLLQRILEERRAKWSGRGKYKEPVNVDTAFLGVLPDGWVTASLDMISTDSGYGTSQKCGYENDGPAVLRIPNVQHGVLDLQDVKFAPSEFKLGQSDAVSSGDMLIIRTNGSKSLIGRAAVVMTEPQRIMLFASYLIRFRLSKAGCIPAWVSVVWQTIQMRAWIEAHAATSAGQHNVSMTVLAKANIPVPPVAEQARIVAEVDRHLSIIREVEAQIAANFQRAQALRQATLLKIFSKHD